MSQDETFGYELRLDLRECDLEIMSNGEKIKEYTKELCRLIDMKTYGECMIPYFGLEEPKTKGYSLCQFIETSSITGHFSEYKRTIYLNIFSCKKFDIEIATNFSVDFFKSTIYEVDYTVRV